MTTPTRTTRRKPPEPPSQLLNDLQVKQLIDMQRQMGAALQGATASLAIQQRQILKLGGMVASGKALQRRFARQLLGVAAGASAADVRQAYRAKVHAFHPVSADDADVFDLLQVALQLLERSHAGVEP